MGREVSRSRPGNLQSIARAVDYGVRSVYRNLGRLGPQQRIAVAASPAPAIAQAVDAAMRVYNTPTPLRGSSQPKTKKYKARRLMDTAYLAGRYRKFKGKPLKSKAKRMMRKFDTQGTRVNWEEGLELSDAKIVYIGQGLPIRRVFEQFTRSMFRSIWKKAGHNFGNWFDKPELPDNQAQPAIVIYYTTDVGVQLLASVGLASPNATYEQMWLTFDNWLFSTFINNEGVGTGLWANNFRLTRIVLKLGIAPPNPGIVVDSTELLLEGAIARFNYTQSMKVQNVSLASDGGADADQDSDVFNVPLNGRIYEAPGNSLKFKFQGFQALRTSQQFGAFPSYTSAIIRANSTNNVPLEPPEAYEFLNCKKYTKVSLNPGKIKTSVITKKFSVSLDKMFNEMAFGIRADGNGPIYTNQSAPYGTVRVMCLEKVIGNISGTEQPLRVRCEVDTKLQCYVHTKNKIQLCPINVVI